MASIEESRKLSFDREESEIKYFTEIGWVHPCRGVWENRSGDIKVIHVYNWDNSDPVEYQLKYKVDTLGPLDPQIRPDSKDGYLDFPFYGKSPDAVIQLFLEMDVIYGMSSKLKAKQPDPKSSVVEKIR